MNERPTPETDAEVTSYFGKKHPPIVCYHELAKFARCLERERDEARDAAEKAKAFKRVLKDDNAKLRRELAAERALADRLAGVLFGCTARDQNDAYDAWKEARK